MPTHYQGNARERAALDAYIKLTRASETIAARLVRRLARYNLTHGQLGVLEAMLHLGPLCQKEIGKKLLRSSGNVTTVVDNLEKRGLVRRERQVADRRSVTLQLTPKGRRLIQRVFPEHAAAIADMMGRLALSEQQELGRLCRKLGRAAASAISLVQTPKFVPTKTSRFGLTRGSGRNLMPGRNR